MSGTIDNPLLTDNRSYDYSTFPETGREEYHIIAGLVTDGARVLDLGCGNGSLMALLRKKRNASVQGMELSESGVAVCREKGLEVRQGRIDAPLPFPDDSFDYALCNVTIQMVMYPEVLLREMKRVARYHIVSFPNVAYWRNRLDLLFCGRMPQPMLYGYRWYNTGHIHQLSVDDFRSLVTSLGGLCIVRRLGVRHPRRPGGMLARLWPNLFEPIPIFLLEKH
jgi:methionine biosynthesis protein MetW